MADSAAIKQSIVDTLAGNADIQGLLTKDRKGDWPIINGFKDVYASTHEVHLPCITVFDVVETGEISGLNDGYDGSTKTKKEWFDFVCQISCYAKTVSVVDALAVQVEKVILKSRSTLLAAGVKQISNPQVLPLHEPNESMGIFHKALRYRIFYILSVNIP